MGAQIHVRLVSDRYDDKELAPFLGRDFHYEIAQGAIWQNKAPFLTTSEARILYGFYSDGSEDENISPVDPAELIKILTKVKSYLKDHEDFLPFEIDIDDNRMKTEGLPSDSLVIHNSRCWLQGDSLYYDVSTKVRIVNYPMQPNEVDLWIDIADKVEIDGTTYYLKRTTRFEKYAEEIDRVIDFCKYAKRNNEKVYWLNTQ